MQVLLLILQTYLSNLVSLWTEEIVSIPLSVQNSCLARSQLTTTAMECKAVARQNQSPSPVINFETARYSLLMILCD